MSAVSKKIGGVLNAISPCELPQNECQVLYVKQKSKTCNVFTGSGSDPVCDQVHVFAIMQSAKVEDHDGRFV